MIKLNSLALALSICVAAGAAVVPQDDKPAEQVYKNIVVFKGSPARDVLPSMNFICSSLKVKCGFCHVRQDFASDEKQEKQTARRMIDMERRLNDQFFNGRTAVTCVSCHNGKTSPTRMALPANLSARHQRVEGVTAGAVLKKYFEATGKNLATLVLKGTSEREGEKPTPLELAQTASHKFHLSFGGMQIGYDGVDTWRSNGPHVNKVLGDGALRMQRMGRSFRGEHAFDTFGDLEVGGRDKLDGRSVIVLQASVAANKNTEEFYFDESTGLLVRVATITESPLGRFAEYYDYSNYKNVEGAKVPFSVTSTTAEGETSVMRFRSAKANVALSEKMFELPAEVPKP